MSVIAFLISSILATTRVAITEPVDGETYLSDWLTIRAIVENDNELPDSVHFSLNGEPVIQIPRLNTDWNTYMANDCRLGYSESPAPHDNTVLWTAPITGIGHEFVSPVIVDCRVYHASEEQETAFCLDAATGAEIWRFEDIGDAIDDGFHVQDGRAYLASDSVWCLDALTGDKIWAFGTGGVNYFNGPPTVYEDKVFVSDQNSRIVYGLDILTGEVVWSTDTLTPCASTITAWNNLIFVPSSFGHLYALSAETGQEEWTLDVMVSFWDSSPTIVNGEIYIGTVDASLYRIDALTGTILDEFEYPGLYYIESTPAIFNEHVFFGIDNFFYCVDRFSGIPEWIFPITDEDFLHASAGIADGLVFWGDHDGGEMDSTVLIHAVDVNTGNEVWNYSIEEAWKGVLSSPAIVDGVMYIGAGDGNLYAFGTGLKYTYLDPLFYADIGSNELVVTSFDAGMVAAADTINFTVTGTGINLKPSRVFNLTISPNPFVSTASISFELSEAGFTSVEIFDLSGRVVISLVNTEMIEGPHSFQWNGCSQNGEGVSAGLFLCRIESDGVTETTSLCLLR